MPDFDNRDDIAFLRIRNRDENVADKGHVFRGETFDQNSFDCFEFTAGQFGEFKPILANDGAWMITDENIVQRVRNLRCTAKVQFYDFTNDLAKAFGRTVPSYFLWNVLNVWDCFDKEGSDIRYSENDIGQKYILSIYRYSFEFEKSGISKTVGKHSLFQIHRHPIGK